MKRVSEIKFPVIIISCKNDERVPISHPERVYSYSKNSKYVAFDYCEDHGEAYETNKEKFMQEFERVYEDADNGIFLLEEWPDSFVFGNILKGENVLESLSNLEN